MGPNLNIINRARIERACGASMRSHAPPHHRRRLISITKGRPRVERNARARTSHMRDTLEFYYI